MTVRTLIRIGLVGLILASSALITTWWSLRGYERADNVWAYQAHDLGAAPGSKYKVIYLGALGGKHTVYHGGCVQNGVVGTSINLPNRAQAYDPQPCLVKLGEGFPVTVLTGRDGRGDEIRGGIVFALNKRGQATGTLGRKCLFFDGSRSIGLEPLAGFNASEGRGINSRGDIVGFSEIAGSDSYLHEHATIWDAQGPHDLGVPTGCLSSRANAINDDGVIVVAAISAKRRTLSYVWRQGKFRFLGTLGGGATVAEAINNREQIVGTSEVHKGIFHPFLWETGKMTDLGALSRECNYSKATGVNDAGQVVGWSGVGEGWSSATRPFLWTPRLNMQDLTKLLGLGSTVEPRTAYGISTSGDILVYGYRRSRWDILHALLILRPI